MYNFRAANYEFQPVLKLIQPRILRRHFHRICVNIQSNGLGHTQRQRR
jgi:hypothetical protein